MAQFPGVILGLCATAFVLIGWGQEGINIDSATYAVVARNMVESGEWFAPHYTAFYLSKFAEHPPLVPWVQGLLFLLVEPNDNTARIFGALCTLGSVLAVYHLGRLIAGKSLGFVSGLVLLLTYNFMQIGNSTLLDVPMTFFVLLALVGMATMQKNGITARRAILTGISIGLAWLAKGVVALPVSMAILLTIIFWHRSWLKNPSFYLLPIVAVGIRLIHLALDQTYNDGYFFDYYFYRQILGKFIGGGGGGDWWAFSVRFVQLYLPFVAVLPLGIYLAIKKRTVYLYPLVFTLALYVFFYSGASRLYYHYFSPAYALSAVLVAVPIVRIMSARRVAQLSVWFCALWLCIAIGVRAAGVSVHHVRSPQLYDLTEPVDRLLGDSPTRNGLFVSEGDPDWEIVAKTSWYWHSDIKQVPTMYEAMSKILTSEFAYILIENRNTTAIALARDAYSEDIQETISNDRFSLIIPR